MPTKFSVGLFNANWTSAVQIQKPISKLNFVIPLPLNLPGTPLFTQATSKGYLPKDYDPDKMHWQKANMKNTIIPPEELEEIRNEAWQSINRGNYVNYKKDMVVEDTNTGEIHTLGTDVNE